MPSSAEAPLFLSGGRYAPVGTNHRHGRLLPPRGERPNCRRAAEPGDEIAPSKANAHLALPSTWPSRPQQWIKPEGAGQQAFGDRADSASFNLGGVIVEHRSGVRPLDRNADRLALRAREPARVHILGRVFTWAPGYSITSSARSRIDGGMASPSALAVLRFTAVSNFTGNCTGRSPGFSPRRMRLRLWEVSAPLLKAPPPIRVYAPGSWGPNAIHQLVAPHAWRLPFERAWRDPDATGA